MSGTVAVNESGIVGFLHRPGQHSARALALTHGAGGNCQAPVLVKVADVLQQSGWWVLRYELPFRQKRKFGPPSPATAAADREGIRGAATFLRQTSGADVALGGHSYGGRQSSMLLAEDPSIAVGLLLLSYPLHPPGKPSQLRTAHFPAIQKPALFVHGAKDEFGDENEMTVAIRAIPAPTELVILPGAGHDLKKGAFDIVGVVSTFTKLIEA